MALFPCWSRITDYFCGSFFDKNHLLNMVGKFTQREIHKLHSHSVCLFTISHRAAGINLPPSLSPVGQSWPPDSHVEQPIVFTLEGRTRWLWGFDICVGTFLCFTRFEISAAANSFVTCCNAEGKSVLTKNLFFFRGDNKNDRSVMQHLS